MNPVTLNNAGEAARAVKHGEHHPGPSSVRRSGTIGKLALALAKAQGEMKNPPKDTENTYFKSRYADLATVRDAVIPVLSRHGLSVIQLPCEMDDVPALTTILMHGESGEFFETTVKLRGKLDPQGVGSALTYLRRYSLQALAGVASEVDDDGNTAASVPAPKPQAAPKEVTQYAAKDNATLRARHAMNLAQAANKAEVDKVAGDIAFDVRNGTLSEADVNNLRAALEDARKRTK